MYRTRDWRRAQFYRIVKRLIRREQANGIDYHLPNPVEKFYSWHDDKGIKRHYNNWQDVHDYRLKRSRRLVNNRVVCSASCCGNQRKWYGETTIQEKRFELTCSDIY